MRTTPGRSPGEEQFAEVGVVKCLERYHWRLLMSAPRLESAPVNAAISRMDDIFPVDTILKIRAFAHKHQFQL
jgi:hypothetical protein